MKKAVPLITILITSYSFGQEYGDPEYYLIDSLDISSIDSIDREIVEESLIKYHESNEDSLKVNAIGVIAEEVWDYNVWPRYNDWLLAYVNRKLNTSQSDEYELYYKKAYSSALNNKGFYEHDLGNINVALEYYFQSLKIDKEINSLEGMASAHSNIGRAFKDQGNLESAIEHYEKCRKIRERLGDTGGLATIYNNLGVIYDDQFEVELALEHYEKALEFNLLNDDIDGAGVAYNNLGVASQNKGEYEQAKTYYEEGLKMYKQAENTKGRAQIFNNLGLLHVKMKKYSEAANYLEQSMAIYTSLKNQNGISSVLGNQAKLLLEENKIDQAFLKAEQALEISQEVGNVGMIHTHARMLRIVAVKKQNWSLAYQMFELETLMRDSLGGLESKQAVANLKAQMEFDQKQAEQEKLQAVKDATFQKQLDLEKEREKRQRTISYFAIGGLVLVVGFLFFVFNRLKITRQQKEEIDKQKEELQETHEQLAEHHQEIADSILYAKRIQEAIMPSMLAMKGVLKKGFVMYIPKDVVAGDFYWMEPIGADIYFAAADCTGHGVPGAMVSVVCSNALNKALLEEGLREPGEILDRAREIVIDRMGKSGEEVKDGMDISLCAFNKHTLELKWAGAYNPLWILRNGEILETKADKQPVGMTSLIKPFTTHTIHLEENDLIYVFTDGIQDQFGGPKGKKFKAKQLKELLLVNHMKDMNEQHSALEKAFYNWKGDIEQVDDVCMIGIRV